MRKTRNKVVMIVDDDASRRRIIYEILKAAGVDLVSAIDGDEAMSSIPREQPHLVLVNMHSTRVRGLDFIKELRMYGLGQRIKVAAMVSDDKQMRTNAKAAGADEVVERNVNPHELVDLMRKLLGIEKFNLPTHQASQRGVVEEDLRGRVKKDVAAEEKKPKGPRQITDDAGKKKI